MHRVQLCLLLGKRNSWDTTCVAQKGGFLFNLLLECTLEGRAWASSRGAVATSKERTSCTVSGPGPVTGASSCKEVTSRRLVCCFHPQPNPDGILSVIWDPLQEVTRSWWAVTGQSAGLPMVPLPTVFNLVVSMGSRMSGQPGHRKEQGQFTDDAEVHTDMEGTFLPAALCICCGWAALGWGLFGCLHPHPHSCPLNSAESQRRWISNHLEFLLTFLGVFDTWGCFLFTCMPVFWGFPSLWFARKIRKTQLYD